jgi:hypothetical protein
MFGQRPEIYSVQIGYQHRGEVNTLLALLDAVPPALIDLPANEFLEFNRCRASLVTALASWGPGDRNPARDVGGKDPVERIRRLMQKCHDELPPAEPELPFIADAAERLDIEERVRAAWKGFNAREWMGATVFAGSALEAVLLWALRQTALQERPKRPLEEMHLHDLVAVAVTNNVISAEARQQSDLARDARNLVHPGKAIRSGESCTKATALSALAGLYRVIDELRKKHGKA